MGLLDILSKEKISVSEDLEPNAISFKEAQVKVQNAINNISSNQGLELDEAFEKVLTLNRANTFISELKKHIKTLNEMPQRCRKSYYTDTKDTHDLIYKKYTTVFQIIENRVHILTIFRQK